MARNFSYSNVILVNDNENVDKNDHQIPEIGLFLVTQVCTRLVKKARENKGRIEPLSSQSLCIKPIFRPILRKKWVNF